MQGVAAGKGAEKEYTIAASHLTTPSARRVRPLFLGEEGDLEAWRADTGQRGSRNVSCHRDAAPGDRVRRRCGARSPAARGGQPAAAAARLSAPRSAAADRRPAGS